MSKLGKHRLTFTWNKKIGSEIRDSMVVVVKYYL